MTTTAPPVEVVTMVVVERTQQQVVEAPVTPLEGISALASHSQLVTVGPSCPGPPLLFKV